MPTTIMMFVVNLQVGIFDLTAISSLEMRHLKTLTPHPQTFTYTHFLERILCDL